MNSLLNFELIRGDFTATIESFKEVPARYADDDTLISSAFIAVTLRLHTGDTIETRWYPGRIAYIMRRLNSQFDNICYKLSDLLNYATTHPFNISVSIDPKWGQQVDY